MEEKASFVVHQSDIKKYVINEYQPLPGQQNKDYLFTKFAIDDHWEIKVVKADAGQQPLPFPDNWKFDKLEVDKKPILLKGGVKKEGTYHVEGIDVEYLGIGGTHAKYKFSGGYIEKKVGEYWALRILGFS